MKDNQQQRIVLLSEKSVIRIWKRQNEASDEVSNDLIYFGIVSSPRDIRNWSCQKKKKKKKKKKDSIR